MLTILEGIEKSDQNALYYYKIAASHRYRLAQNRLGDAPLEGKLGLKKSLEKAIEYFHLAANQKCSSSLEIMGRCYEKGEGVEQSLEKSFFLLQFCSKNRH